MKRWLTTLTILALTVLAGNAGALAEFQDSPVLAARSKAGELPPVDERLPEAPFVDAMDQPWQSPGKYGGTLGIFAR